jgi:TRAP-type C4-dicarboxylate transport system permease small subunit
VKSAVTKIIAALEAFERAVLLAALLGMLLSVMVAIAARPLGADVPWTTPAVLALMIVATFAGAALATSTRRHITMDLLTKALKPRGRAMISIVTALLGIGITVTLALSGSHWVKANMEFEDPISLALKLPDWWLQAVVPIGFSLCALHFLLNIVRDAIGLVTGDLSHLPDPNSAASHGVMT